MIRLKKILLGLLVAGMVFAGSSSPFKAKSSSGASASSENKMLFSDLCVTAAEYEKLIADKASIAAPLVSEIAFNDYALLCDWAQEKWYYSLIEGNAASFDPLVNIKSDNSKQECKLAFKCGGINAQTVADGKSIPIIVYNEQYYYECELICTTLPLMNIESDYGVADYGETRTRISLFDNRHDAEERIVFSEAIMHVRGNSARDFPKKGYKVSLKYFDESGIAESRDVSLLGMRDDDDWHLSACYNDPERIRNVFSSELWKQSCAYNNSLRVDNGMRYEYVEVFMNGSYHGLYALGYPIDEKQMELGRSAFGATDEYIYKKFNWSTEYRPDLERMPYMLGYEIKGNSSGDETAAWKTLTNFYVNKHYKAPEDTSIFYEIVDIDNAIDLHLFILLIQGVDNFQTYLTSEPSINNMILTAKQKDGQTVMLYTPWDMDLTWGNDYSGTLRTSYVLPYDISPDYNVPMRYSVVQELMNAGDKEIISLVKARYTELRAGKWSEDYILSIIEDFEKDIFASGAFGRDCSRWPYSAQIEGLHDLSLFKAFVHERLKYMDEYVNAM